MNTKPAGALPSFPSALFGFLLPRWWYAPVAAVVIAVALAGCTTAPIYLKHTETGRVVECGPYFYSAAVSVAAALREAQCIEDYKQQGYRRGPAS